jgi:hypothetical protein
MFQKLSRNRTKRTQAKRTQAKRTQAKRGRQNYCCFDQTAAYLNRTKL